MPENGSVANTLGYLLAEQNTELKLAEQLVESAIKSDKQNRATYYDSLAWVHYKRGNIKNAYKLQKKAISIFKLAHEPISSDVYYHMGKIQVKMNNSIDAKSSFESAMKSNTDADIVKLASESLALIK